MRWPGALLDMFNQQLSLLGYSQSSGHTVIVFQVSLTSMATEMLWLLGHEHQDPGQPGGAGLKPRGT